MPIKKRRPGLVYYKDKRGKHRWRLVGGNHEIVGASTQGFASRQKARENAKLVCAGLCKAKP